jgi:hypothetical protein
LKRYRHPDKNIKIIPFWTQAIFNQGKENFLMISFGVLFGILAIVSLIATVKDFRNPDRSEHSEGNGWPISLVGFAVFTVAALACFSDKVSIFSFHPLNAALYKQPLWEDQQ